MLDLIIRNGLIYDGSGGEAFASDIGIAGGVIVAVGKVDQQAFEEIDARGLIVTPGFVDVHTHYDGQLTWSSHTTPSCRHGVTTVVTGNCGVGFAPCRAADHTRLTQLLEGVEDIPEIVSCEGLQWDWESFPEYIEALGRREHDIDYAVQLPHSALRVFVMGDRAVDRQPSTPADRELMAQLAKEAIEGGAIGFGTSRSVFHRTPSGDIIPTAHAEEAELLAIAGGIASGGGGSMQAILDVHETARDLRLFRSVAGRHGLSVSFSLFEDDLGSAKWRDLLTQAEESHAEGVPVFAQAFPRPIGMLIGLDLSFHPFSAHPSYRRIADLPLDERVREMRRPETRSAILAEQPLDEGLPGFEFARKLHNAYPLSSPPCYEPPADTSVAAVAASRGIPAEEVAYDLLLEEDGRNILMVALANYEFGSLDSVREMIMHPLAVPALGDGGAHYGMICDATYPTTMLTHWARDRPTGNIALSRVVEMLTSRPAAMLGLTDRGLIAPGLRANLNIIDHDRLILHRPRVVYDLPAGGRRIAQDATGYVATIVGGKVILRNGEPTGHLPGKLARRITDPAVAFRHLGAAMAV